MKRYLIELIGTFFVVVAISFTGNSNPIAVGLMLMSMVYLASHVSGAHFNPAISLACFLRGLHSIQTTAFYWLSQIVGACLAIFLFKAITGQIFNPETVAELSLSLSITMEALLTAVFCTLFLTIMHASRFRNFMANGFVVGLSYTALLFIGGLFNPAVILGALCCGLASGAGIISTTPSLLVYLVAPCIGAVVAAYAQPYLNEERQFA